jgi:hypothetical protein
VPDRDDAVGRAHLAAVEASWVTRQKIEEYEHDKGEEQEEQKGEIEMKKMMTFVDTIKERERRDLGNREG